MFWGELFVVLFFIVIGARMGGIGIGLAGGAGLVVLVFGFHLQPTSPPIDVILIILSIITLVSTMQAAGGLDYLVAVAERILRRHPSRITIIAPVVAYFFSVFCGTAYVAYAIYPVIIEVAYSARVRPERPLSISTVAASQAVTASPLSAATAVLVTLVVPHGVTIGHMLMVLIPAGFVGVIVGALSVYTRGTELELDPEFQRRLASGELQPPSAQPTRSVATSAKVSVFIFAWAVSLVVILGSMPSLLPTWDVGGKVVRLSMPHALQMIMLCCAAVSAISLKTAPAKIIASPVFNTGMMAIVSIFGIAWMVDTFFHGNQQMISLVMSAFVQEHPQMFSVALLLTAALMMSQGAAIRAIGPLGMALGIPAGHMVAFFHAAAAVNVIPGTGAVIGVTSMDRTGTTKIGRFVFNHSFIKPCLVTSVSSVLVAYGLANLLL